MIREFALVFGVGAACVFVGWGVGYLTRTSLTGKKPSALRAKIAKPSKLALKGRFRPISDLAHRCLAFDLFSRRKCERNPFRLEHTPCFQAEMAEDVI
jgi:hypothetical protein